MSLFKREPVTDRLLSEITTLSKQVAELRGEGSALRLSAELANLKQEKAMLEIELDKLREAHERENRELDHKLGLHKKQVEHERKAAVQEAKLTVREENLGAERDRFEKEIEFRTQRFEAEADTLKNLMNQVLNRLPTVNFERTIHTTQHLGERELTAGDGDGE